MCSSYCALTGCCKDGDEGRLHKRREFFQCLLKDNLLNGFNYKICKGTHMQNSELTRNWIINMNTTQKITFALYETSINKPALPRFLCSDEPNFRKWT